MKTTKKDENERKIPPPDSFKFVPKSGLRSEPPRDVSQNRETNTEDQSNNEKICTNKRLCHDKSGEYEQFLTVITRLVREQQNK